MNRIALRGEKYASILARLVLYRRLLFRRRFSGISRFEPFFAPLKRPTPTHHAAITARNITLILFTASAHAAQPTPAPTASAPGAAVATATESSGQWEPKDYVLAAGVLVTLLLGIWNAVGTYRSGRRTTFINTITSQRIKWIEQLRQDVSAYAGLIYHWAYTEIPEGDEQRSLMKEVDRLTHVIRLRLNPASENDQKIEQLLREIHESTEDQNKVTDLLEKLTITTQNLLKEEWEKVKRESKHGPLSERA